jgi:hypothetical protein
LKFWGLRLLPPSKPPAHTTIEPVGVMPGDGGGYGVPLIVLTAIVLVVRLNEVMVFDVCIFVVNRLGVVIETPAVTLDVTKVFILPDKELKLKHPMLLAVIMPLDMKDVDIVLMVAYREATLNVLTFDVMTEPYGAGSVVSYVLMAACDGWRLGKGLSLTKIVL